MHSYSLIAPAKINLYLEIIGNRPDGFHELAMILQSIELADIIDLEMRDDKSFLLHCDHTQVPVDGSNLAYKAAELMAGEFPEAFAKYGGLDITISKNIPVAAGLAGGSSNAAAVLVGIDLLWNLGLTQSELGELGARLGSDVPFCILGGTAIATGRGEQLAPLPYLEDIYIVLAKYRSLEVSTAGAYKSYRQEYGHTYLRDTESLAARAAAVHSGEMVKAILQKNPQEIAQKLHNDLEKVILPTYPQVRELRETFSQMGILGTMMSGSGPSVFAICASKTQAEEVKLQMRNRFPNPDLELFVTKMSHRGIHVDGQ
ncbi:4-(cytidine 5'-diphospho)-2-C-methyl-D-erythritol kinase [Calothrix sp. 336/3]|uniref:4-(cytidine 5'-diphospho)-2-C-methyl-D-erythritol kinase n=1 Tax=Calothrix sp. 336/3 TaxID=1337936 RepID=UPI0004E3FAF0|nr:4-(cytidine 5'-diphospho)-2-C-methyl-D-erythritol kinase [Calothrix sp. 336/3]AKG20190.1 4-diphosphocytidyl-2C-methyl-D-erythritol kinase [Calothrix sp. 336/3]